MTVRELAERCARKGACTTRDHGNAFIRNGLNDVESDQLIAICDTCTVRLSCFRVVDPHTSLFSGVAAGIKWAEGVPCRLPDGLTARQIDGYVGALVAQLSDVL